MGRWTQYDEDSYRLPEGVTRTGYDADTGRYLFNGVPGIPHTRYGVLAPGEGRRNYTPKQREGGQLRRREPLVLPIYPSKPTQIPSKAKSESASKSLNIPNAMRALRRVMLASLAVSRRRPRKRLANFHTSSTDPNPTAGVEKLTTSEKTSYTSTSKEKYHNSEKHIEPAADPPERATRSTGLHTRSFIDHGRSATLPLSSRSSCPPEERRRTSESHNRPFSHNSNHQEKSSLSAPRRSSANVKEKPNTSQSHTQNSSLHISIAKNPLAQIPVDAQKFSNATPMEPGSPTTPSSDILTGKKPGVTDASTRTPSKQNIKVYDLTDKEHLTAAIFSFCY